MDSESFVLFLLKSSWGLLVVTVMDLVLETFCPSDTDPERRLEIPVSQKGK